MPDIRVLIVDDSVVVRKLLSTIVDREDGLCTAGVAQNGRIALAKLSTVTPDIVILDFEMPEMDGLQALKALRKTHPELPVIMFSALTQRGAAITLDALDAGANDYVTKPLNSRNRQESVAQIRRDLVPRIKALCSRKQLLSGPPRPGARRSAAAGSRIRDKVDVVAIGISTGGPSALAKLMPKLPKDLPVPIVLVQHMPPIFTASLAARLNDISEVAVTEAKEGDILRPGNVYLAAGGRHMVLQEAETIVGVKTNMDPPERGCRPAVDVLFRSVVAIYGSRTLGVILTGMGQDGLIGCEHINAAGGQIIVQDEPSSVVWGMPGAVAKAGFADQVLPLDQIGLEITRRVRRNRNISPSRRPGKLSADRRSQQRVHM